MLRRPPASPEYVTRAMSPSTATSVIVAERAASSSDPAASGTAYTAVSASSHEVTCAPPAASAVIIPWLVDSAMCEHAVVKSRASRALS